MALGPDFRQDDGVGVGSRFLLRHPGFDPGSRVTGGGAAWFWVLTFVWMTGWWGRVSYFVILGLTQDPGLRGVALLGSGS